MSVGYLAYTGRVWLDGKQNKTKSAHQKTAADTMYIFYLYIVITDAANSICDELTRITSKH